MALLDPLRRRLAWWILALVPIGLATKCYEGPASSWVGGQLGGVLYVVFWVVVAVFLWPKLRPWATAAAVLLVTSSLEFLQLVQNPALDAIRGTFLGQALIGSTFSWWDLPYYSLGAAAGFAVVRYCSTSKPGPTAGAALFQAEQRKKRS